MLIEIPQSQLHKTQNMTMAYDVVFTEVGHFGVLGLANLSTEFITAKIWLYTHTEFISSFSPTCYISALPILCYSTDMGAEVKNPMFVFIWSIFGLVRFSLFWSNHTLSKVYFSCAAEQNKRRIRFVMIVSKLNDLTKLIISICNILRLKTNHPI